MSPLLVGLAAAVGVWLLLPGRPRLPTPERQPRPRSPGRPRRGWWAGLAGLAGAVLVQGTAGLVVAGVLAAATWWVLGRSEPAEVRRQRAAVRRDLPHLVTLLAAALRAGAAPAPALRLVCAALPGAAADRLGGVSERLDLGVDPARVWESLAGDPHLAPLGRTMARAHATGASVSTAVERLADDLERTARSWVEDRARAVGVRAALPLGLCLLPAFILLGIVPVVAGLITGLTT